MTKGSDKRLYENVSLHPFKFITPSVGSITVVMLVVLLPQIIMLFATRSFSSIFVLLASIAGTCAAEGVYVATVKRENYNVTVTLIQGIIIGLMLPSTYQIPAVFFIVFSTFLILKYAFGGFSSSWVNICAATVAAAYVINIAAFPESPVTLVDLQSRNAALTLIQNGTVPLVKFDTSITQFFNKVIFGLFGVSVPDGYVSLFWDCHSVIPAFRFNFLTMLSGIILVSFEFLDWIIPAFFILVYGLLIRFCEPLVVEGIAFQGDMLLAFLTGGTMFVSVFLLQWFGTTPITWAGKMIYGISGGVVAFLIAGYGMSPCGMAFTVLVMNIISPVIQYVESKQVKGRLKKRLMPEINRLKQEAENV